MNIQRTVHHRSADVSVARGRKTQIDVGHVGYRPI